MAERITDTLIVAMPEILEGNAHTTNHEVHSQLGPWLDRVAQDQIDQQTPQIPRTLVLQEYTVTCSAEKAEEWPLPHDCASCLEGREKAVAFLRANPGRHVILGKLVYDQ